MTGLGRRASAIAVAAVLVAAVAADLAAHRLSSWWDRHPFTASVVSDLLVVAATVLIVDQVVARRQRRARATSVAVQTLIVYNQVLRTYQALDTAPVGADTDTAPVGAGVTAPLVAGPETSPDSSTEMRTLAGMLLTAAPSLFDDPDARRFLEQVERFLGLLFRLRSAGSADGTVAARTATQLAAVTDACQPLRDRIPAEERTALQELPED